MVRDCTSRLDVKICTRKTLWKGFIRTISLTCLHSKNYDLKINYMYLNDTKGEKFLLSVFFSFVNKYLSAIALLISCILIFSSCFVWLVSQRCLDGLKFSRKTYQLEIKILFSVIFFYFHIQSRTMAIFFRIDCLDLFVRRLCVQ